MRGIIRIEIELAYFMEFMNVIKLEPDVRECERWRSEKIRIKVQKCH